MKRENRYLVFKYKDLTNCLDDDDWDFLNQLNKKVNEYRETKGKEILTCVIVENDWPEYSTVWNLIETRVNNENPIPRLTK
jgi:glutamate/tyrosine decarboxylase-like PLP-dependent enzyme